MGAFKMIFTRTKLCNIQNKKCIKSRGEIYQINFLGPWRTIANTRWFGEPVQSSTLRDKNLDKKQKILDFLSKWKYI